MRGPVTLSDFTTVTGAVIGPILLLDLIWSQLHRTDVNCDSSSCLGSLDNWNLNHQVLTVSTCLQLLES